MFAFAARADAQQPVGIYWANANTHTIGFATGDAVIVDNNFVHVAGGFPNGVAVYGDFVYWTVPDANAIGRAGMNGTGVDQTFITGLQGVQGVAVNSAGIFWTNTDTGSIGRANLDGTGINQNFRPPVLDDSRPVRRGFDCARRRVRRQSQPGFRLHWRPGERS